MLMTGVPSQEVLPLLEDPLYMALSDGTVIVPPVAKRQRVEIEESENAATEFPPAPPGLPASSTTPVAFQTFGPPRAADK